MTAQRQAVQMVGTQRSGSNLLRLMLGQVPGVFAPPSVHLLEVLEAVVVTYPDLETAAGRRRLLEDVRRLISVNALPWPEGPPPIEAIEASLAGPSAGEVFVATHDAAARGQGCALWISKDLENFTYCDQLVAAVPNLKWIHLIRDGRDVALSFARAPVGPKHAAVLARKWVEEQEAIAQIAGRSPGHVCQVRYEELITRPVEVLYEVARFLDVIAGPQVLEFHRTSMAGQAARRSPLWVNLDSPVLRGNTGRFRNPNERPFVECFERVACAALSENGYEPLYVHERGELSAEEWRKAEMADQALRAQAKRRADPQLEVFHAPYEAFVAELRERSGSVSE